MNASSRIGPQCRLATLRRPLAHCLSWAIVPLLVACNQGSSGSGVAITQLRTFSTIYGTKGDDHIFDVQPTFDFGRIVAGRTDPREDDKGDGWLMKQDLDGNVEWSRAYGDGVMDILGNAGMNWSANGALDSNQIDVVADERGGCIVVGGRLDGYRTDADVRGPVFRPVALRLDRNGRVDWRIELPGGERGGRFLDVEKEEWSENFFAVGYAEDLGPNLDARNRDALVVSFTGDGTVRWQSIFGDDAHEVVTGIDFVSGGRGAPPHMLTLVGTRTLGVGADGSVGVFLQMQNERGGAVLVNEIVHFGEAVRLLDVQREPFTQDFHVVGTVMDDKNDSYTNDQSLDLLVVEFDATNGSQHWDATFEVAEGFHSGDYGFAVAPDIDDRGLFVAGYGGLLSRDALMAYCDSDGDFDRDASASYGDDSTRDEFHSVVRTSRESFLVAGRRGERAWVAELSAELDQLWSNEFEIPGGASHGMAVSEGFADGESTGYFVAGTGSAGGWVLHLDLGGAQRWMRTVHDDTRDEIHAVRQTDDDGDGLRDDGYLAFGTSGSTRWREQDAWLMKVDAQGGIEWQKRLGRHDRQDGGAVLELLPADGVVVAGTSSEGEFPGDLYLEGLTFAGESVWRRTFRHDHAQEIVAVAVAEDALYYVGRSLYNSSQRGIVGKLQLDGSDASAWTDVLLDFLPRAAVIDHEGTLIVAGKVGATSASPSHLAISRIDTNGTVLEELVLPATEPGPDDGAFALLAHEESIYVAADTRSQALTGETCESESGAVPCANVHVLRLTSGLKIEWERTYSNVYEDRVRALAFSEDGTLLVAGETDSAFLVIEEEARGQDGWLLKMELDGFIGTQCPSYGRLASSVAGSGEGGRPTTVANTDSGDLFVEDTDLRGRSIDAELVVDTLCHTPSRSHRVTIRVEGAGRVVDPRHAIDCPRECRIAIREGLPVQLLAIPDDGAEFLGWDSDCPDGQFVVDGPVTCVARFSGGGGGDGGSDDGEGFAGYWDISVSCFEECSSGDSREYEDVKTVRIDVSGNTATIENFNNNQIYQGTITGDRIDWFATYTFEGAQWEEVGSYVLLDAGKLSEESRYAWANAEVSCSGTCSGTGAQY